MTLAQAKGVQHLQATLHGVRSHRTRERDSLPTLLLTSDAAEENVLVTDCKNYKHLTLPSTRAELNKLSLCNCHLSSICIHEEICFSWKKFYNFIYLSFFIVGYNFVKLLT